MSKNAITLIRDGDFRKRNFDMPYIEAKLRPPIDSYLVEVINGDNASAELQALPDNAGELNYAISQLLFADEYEYSTFRRVHKVCTDYLDRKGLRYAYINDVLGALDGARREFMRRVPAHTRKARRHWIKLVLGHVADEIYSSIAADYEDQKMVENGDLNYAKVPV